MSYCSSLPSGMWIGCLDKSHADLVQGNWRYGYSETRESILYLLEKLPSAAVYVGDGDSARPVSWIQSYRYGSLGNTFTLPEYRRKGLASAVTLTLAKKVAACGRPVYLMIEDYNEDSKRMHEKMGFRKACLMTWHFFLPPRISLDDV
ncbi:glycine N-acyltransferase-like protein 1 [Oratosquilla oratoria]|uniref:glycine N-acyltransferase-like protein 1 n=1 Tax=Oratosquilla oratoria TaxID=337810 RepID=UPI003F75ADEB